jgi:hypothetical protein
MQANGEKPEQSRESASANQCSFQKRFCFLAFDLPAVNTRIERSTSSRRFEDIANTSSVFQAKVSCKLLWTIVGWYCHVLLFATTHSKFTTKMVLLPFNAIVTILKHASDCGNRLVVLPKAAFHETASHGASCAFGTLVQTKVYIDPFRLFC